MPHGTGHHGGGGHHHGGGGFHHHHHRGGYHHHHHRHWGAGRWWGPGWGYWGWGWGAPYYARPYGYRRRYYNAASFWCFWIFVVVFFLIFLSAALSIRYDGDGGKGGYSSKTYFAPGDTRTFSYSSRYCQKLKLMDSSNVSATLYLLRNKPPLINNDSFTVNISRPKLNPGDYSYWYYYLYPGSNFSMKYCLESSPTQPIKFFLIRKQSKFESWEDNPSSKYAVRTTDIQNSCQDGKKSLVYNFTSSAEEYYFVFDNPGKSSSVLAASLYFERKLYNVSPDNIVHHCQVDPSFGSSTCTVDVPYNSHYTALIVVDASQQTDYESNLDIDWSCEPRVWVYVIIVVIPFVFLVFCVSTTLIFCCYFGAKRRRKYQSLNADTSESSSAPPPVPSESADASAPPPYNPGYGATFDGPPPPMYK